MHILYGVVGEGMGHATRSGVVIAGLLERGHQVTVLSSQAALRYLQQQVGSHPSCGVLEVAGLGMAYKQGRLAVKRTAVKLAVQSPMRLHRNVETWAALQALPRPDVVISDFEGVAWAYGRSHGIPVISLDNAQVLARCQHEPRVTDGDSAAFQLARTAVRSKMRGCYHYLVTSFFFPTIRDVRTTLVPPVVRPAIAVAERDAGEHWVVYQSVWSERLIEDLGKLGVPIRAYGANRTDRVGAIQFCAFSEAGLIEDLRTARAAIAGGGFSFMSECVAMGVPLLSIPLVGQFEQELNARYLQELGLGRWSRALTASELAYFRAALPAMEARHAEQVKHDQSFLFACLEELFDKIAQGEPAPAVLDTPAPVEVAA